MFGKAQEYGALELGTWATEFDDRVDVQSHDHIMVKKRVNAFYNTDLETVLRANNIGEIVMVGVSTDMAIQSAARDGHDKDYNITILEDACAACDETVHKNSIDCISRIANIVTTNQWCETNV